jgi:hypothetical protein
MNRVKEERKKRRYVNTPNGRVDLDGSPMSREEWMEACTRANPLDNYLRKKKAFETSEPREKALKLLRSRGQHYLLNRASIGIETLRYDVQVVSDLGKEESGRETYVLADLPSTSFVGIGPVPRAAQRSRKVWIVQVEWKDGETVEAPMKLREWAPYDGGTRASRLDLRYVPRIST